MNPYIKCSNCPGEYPPEQFSRYCPFCNHSEDRMTNMTPYSDISSYLRGLYRALDERDKLAAAGRRSSLDYDHWNHTLANLAGTLAIGDPRLLPEENEFLRHLLHIEGFTFDGCSIAVPGGELSELVPGIAVPDVELEHDHFHGCPKCPKHVGPDGIYNAGRLQRAACHARRTTWIIGSNLFSGWRDETEEQQRTRWSEIEEYADVSPRAAA